MLNQRYAGVATTQTPKSYVCARAEAAAGAGAGAESQRGEVTFG